jgi:hypothetical protein
LPASGGPLFSVTVTFLPIPAPLLVSTTVVVLLGASKSGPIEAKRRLPADRTARAQHRAAMFAVLRLTI